MVKKKLNKRWLYEHTRDPYVKLAKKIGYRARSAYKLKEIDEIDNLIHSGQVIIDLGSTPGSWSQYVCSKVSIHDRGGVNGMIVGMDILPMKPISGMHFIKGDFREKNSLGQLEDLLAGRKIDLILSDMAPNISGIDISDAARIEEIIISTIEFAKKYSNTKGTLLAKCFNGSSYNSIFTRFRKEFRTVTSRKPKASRGKSAEVFLIGKILESS
jgi:23S rRNA (uridine2552-2'-O)-methyltransferase